VIAAAVDPTTALAVIRSRMSAFRALPGLEYRRNFRSGRI